jgi:hypothetical protein
MKRYEIFFRDLTPEAQKNLCDLFNTTEKDENWDVFPIAEIEREAEEETIKID